MSDPRPDDLAAVRERLRRLIRWEAEADNAIDRQANRSRIADVVTENADALLADPAPEGLADELRTIANLCDDGRTEAAYEALHALADRLSASTEEGTDA